MPSLLGIEFEQKVNKMVSVQETYSKKILNQFWMGVANYPEIQLTEIIDSVAFEGSKRKPEQHGLRISQFRHLFCSLLYLCSCTRHKLSFSVENPSSIHKIAAKRVFCYKLGTKPQGITVSSVMKKGMKVSSAVHTFTAYRNSRLRW